jgi:hypothetical protein
MSLTVHSQPRQRKNHVAHYLLLSMEEIMEVMKRCVVQGMQACNLGVPILAEELATRSAKEAQPS